MTIQLESPTTQPKEEGQKQMQIKTPPPTTQLKPKERQQEEHASTQPKENELKPVITQLKPKQQQQPETTKPQESEQLTPAELAKKIASHLATIQEKPPTNQQQASIAQETSTTSAPPGNSEAPSISVPIDSQLGKLLYPSKADDDGITTHNTSTSLVFDGNKELINTNVDGTNYSAVLVDQAKQLLQTNKIKRKDLIELLKSSHVLDNVQRMFTSDSKKDISLDSLLGMKADARSVVTSSSKHKQTLEEVNNQNIHITLSKKNGQFYLMPNQNEAYEKHYVPQEIGLKPVKSNKIS